MMTAALEGALAFAKGLGAVHAMSHSAGRLEAQPAPRHAQRRAPACGVRFSASRSAPRMLALGEAMGLRKGEEVAGAIEKFNREIGMPASLGEMGVGRDLVDDLVAVALKDSAGATNPVRATADDYRRLYEEAIG